MTMGDVHWISPARAEGGLNPNILVLSPNRKGHREGQSCLSLCLSQSPCYHSVLLSRIFSLVSPNVFSQRRLPHRRVLDRDGHGHGLVHRLRRCMPLAMVGKRIRAETAALVRNYSPCSCCGQKEHSSKKSRSDRKAQLRSEGAELISNSLSVLSVSYEL